MSSPTSLLGDVRGFARDYPRDRLPQGLLWDCVDYIPGLLDAQLTSRGGWDYASNVLPALIEGGIYAPFRTGARLLVNTNGQVYQVDTPGGTVSPQGASPTVVQNPVMLMDQAISPGATGAVPMVYTAPSPSPTAITITPAPSGEGKGRYATVYKNRVLISGVAPTDGRIYFSPLGNALTAWDTAAWQASSLPLTGIGALRSMILAFHAGSVERIRGTHPPDTPALDDGDLILEGLFDRAGCGDAKSIAYWNDNCLFADDRGIHMTDGAVVRNLIAQGGLNTFWRSLYRNRISLAAETYLDYYICTVIRSDAVGAVTLICDLSKRTWFRFSNLRANCYIRSVGVQEEVYWGVKTDNRLGTLSSCFFPVTTGTAQDDDGIPVLPGFETRWERMGPEGRKRVRDVYLSYDLRVDASTSTQWRAVQSLPLAEIQNGQAKAALAEALDVGYVLSPEQTTYVSAGQLPSTSEYTRWKLTIGAEPYGIGFRVKQQQASAVTRIYDLAVDAAPEERSRRSS